MTFKLLKFKQFDHIWGFVTSFEIMENSRSGRMQECVTNVSEYTQGAHFMHFWHSIRTRVAYQYGLLMSSLDYLDSFGMGTSWDRGTGCKLRRFRGPSGGPSGAHAGLRQGHVHGRSFLDQLLHRFAVHMMDMGCSDVYSCDDSMIGMIGLIGMICAIYMVWYTKISQ